MFKKIKEYLEGEATLETLSSGEASNEELQIATAVLLLEMSGRDSDYAPEEIKAIFMEMKSQFGIEEDSEVLELLEKASELRDESEKIDSFVASLNTNYNEEQRGLIFSMAWKVILADGEVEKNEQRFANQLKARLQLSDDILTQAIDRAVNGTV